MLMRRAGDTAWWRAWPARCSREGAQRRCCDCEAMRPQASYHLRAFGTIAVHPDLTPPQDTGSGVDADMRRSA